MNNHHFDVPRPENWTLGTDFAKSAAHLNPDKKVQIEWLPTREAEDTSLSQFKFLLTFENNLCDHYMSEKVWKAYGLGVVPVVFAGRGATASLPADDSFINAAEFETGVALREYMEKVANDEELYMSYFEWMTRPLSALKPGFQNLWRSQIYYAEEVWDLEDDYPTICCAARGVVRAQLDFEAGQLPPPIPGLSCDMAHDWSRYMAGGEATCPNSAWKTGTEIWSAGCCTITGDDMPTLNKESDPIWGACAGKGAEDCAKLQCESHSGPMHKWAGVDTGKHPYACCIDESALDVGGETSPNSTPRTAAAASVVAIGAITGIL